MAKMKLTHIGSFFQEFSHPIPCLKDLRVWERALLERVHWKIRVISVTSGEKTARERLDYDKRWAVVPPYTPYPFLNIS